MSSFSEFQKQTGEYQKKRVGDIREECIKRGCDLRYLEAVDTRVWLYPINQTKAYLHLQDGKNKYAYNFEDHVRQWRILLEVLVELRPNHEKIQEWKESLKILSKGEALH